MSSTLLRSSAARSALRACTASASGRAGLAGVTFTRGKATLPDLPCKSGFALRCLDNQLSFSTLNTWRLTDSRCADDFGALEPSISGKIMELHYKAHHQTYVNSYNNFSEQLQSAEQQQDMPKQIELLPLINFHGGGHLNHSLFWENLAPTKQGGGEPPSGALSKAIDESYGSLDALKEKFNAALAGIQGSGWAWLVQDTQTGSLEIKTYANQDPVVGRWRPLLGIDAWEHAYYLQYQNRKAEYFKAVWDVVNWKAAEKRFK